MNIVVETLRAARMQNLVKGVSRLLGYELWPLHQFPHATWLGLRTYPIRTVLDIGAFNGSWARDFLMPHFPDAIVHCFEPSPRTFPRLMETVRQVGTRMIPHNCALGDTNGQATYHAAVNAPASSSLLPSTAECHAHFPRTEATEDVAVEVRRLDEVAPSLAPPIKDDLLIKMDVQGFEDRVIRGGRTTFARARACVMEVQRANLYEGQPSFRDLFLTMDEFGFDYAGNLDQAHDPKGHVLFFDAVFIRRG